MDQVIILLNPSRGIQDEPIALFLHLIRVAASPILYVLLAGYSEEEVYRARARHDLGLGIDELELVLF